MEAETPALALPLPLEGPEDDTLPDAEAETGKHCEHPENRHLGLQIVIQPHVVDGMEMVVAPLVLATGRAGIGAHW
jgi:hypothetical protein